MIHPIDYAGRVQIGSDSTQLEVVVLGSSLRNFVQTLLSEVEAIL